MRGTPMKAGLADLRDFAQGHRWQFHPQVNNQLTHIWREASRRFLGLFTGSGCKQADHALLVKSIGFALQGRTWLACLFCPLKSWIAEKDNRSQEFICRLLRPERILSNGLPIFSMLSLNSPARSH